MAKVIKFPGRGAALNSTIIKLKNASDDIDSVIIGCLNDPSLDPKEIAGLLAHRLGALLKNMDEKEKLWQVYRKVTEKQAELDNGKAV